MKCPRCQNENPPGSSFCLECGARLALACASCGAELPAGSKFCNKCGTPVATEAPTQSRFASPESYTPKHLAEKILTSKAALEGERKQVTVLFADLKGSMELLADRDPEEARKILDPVLERMMEAVHRYEGTVNQVMGDGIMALFGAPVAHEDHAVRACYAALRMQESVKKYAEEVRRSHAAVVKVRVGLNSGEVVVRAIGSDLHMDYTAVGQTTHLAARMEQIADPGAIVITPETLALAEGYVDVKSLGPVPVKGLAGPVEVYEVTGAGPARTRLQAAARRGLTRFVGRDAELEQLRRAQQLAGSGRGQVAAIVGEAGVGKSRLLYEFTHSHRMQGWLILESGAVSYGKATPYLPVVDLLKAYFRIETRDDAPKIREKVMGTLLTLDEALRPARPAFLALLDVQVEDPQWQSLDPPQRRQRTLDAVKHLLLRESQRQPVLLVFEDLHWIDSETQALLDSLVESVPASRLLLLVSYRSEYQHAWGGKTHYGQHQVEALPTASAEELLRALLGDNTALHQLTRVLIERTEGNPFFMEESVRTLIETHVLIGERGAYRLAKDVATIQVAPSVQAMLAARIDRLPPEAKKLLHCAAVIGHEGPLVLLQAIVEEDDDGVRHALSHLQAGAFVYETCLFPDLEYTFRHALTHEVTYRSLLHEQRRVLHARIVEAIERLYANRLAEHTERLAYHAFRGEVWEKAVSYLRQAGTKALVRSANREAVAYFEQALEALEHLPTNADALESAIDLRFDLRSSLLPLGEFGRIFDYLREAEALAGTLGDQRRLARLFAYMTNYVSLMGDQNQAIEYGQRTLAIAAALGDSALEVETNVRLGQIYHTLGDFRRTIDLLRGSLEALKGHLVHERFGLAVILSVLGGNWLVQSLAEVGEFAEGVARGDEGLRVAEAIGQPIDIVVAAQAIGFLHLRQGKLPAAISVLERGLELCRAWNIRVWFPRVASTLGSAYALSGRAAEALALLEQAAERPPSIGRMGGHALRVAEGYLWAGRGEDAIRFASRALHLSRIYGERGHEAWALRLAGEIASRSTPPDEATAVDNYRRSLALAEELGMRPLIARCYLNLQELYRRIGNRPAAQRHLTTATVLLREMDMRFSAEQEHDERKGLR
jgi:class 3 adenylate cyclase/tetratricopeptide (TPR) repeat protein